MIPNDEDDNDVYDMIPRIGAFEVSTVVAQGGSSEAILLFSKMIGQMWPHVGALSKNIGNYQEEVSKMD